MKSLKRIRTSSNHSSSPRSSTSSSSSPLSTSLWSPLKSVLLVIAASSSASCSSPPPDRSFIKSPLSQRSRKPALSPRQWRNMFAGNGKFRDDGRKLLKIVRSRGVDPSIRAEVWQFLLGVHALNSSKEERGIVNDQNRKEYAQIRKRSINIDASVLNNDESETIVQLNSRRIKDFTTWQRIIRLDAIRANSDWIAEGPSHAPVSHSKARRFAEAVGLKDYDHLEPCQIIHAARLVAILEAYAIYDPEIGYCQGMSDLLSPIITYIENDHTAFWCFVGFMKKTRQNFLLDETGIRRQLQIVSKIIKCKDYQFYRHLEKLQAEDCFFVYRMLVVLFRRELDFDQTICLWEVMWADQTAIRAGIGKSALWSRIGKRAPPTEDLLLYAIAASVLEKRKVIIDKYSCMDEIVKECNNMSGQLDVWKLLDDAHNLVATLHDKLETSF